MNLTRKALAVLAMALFAGVVPPAFANLSCGIPPIPPVGCRVGPCACDSSGQHCSWTFVCS